MTTPDEAARAADFETAKAIIESEDIFALVAETMAGQGFAGDLRQVELLYAIFTSRLMARPMCAFIKAPSSSGKSWLLNRTLELFPEHSYEMKSGVSPKAIAYGSTDLRHKILAIQEASGLNGKEGNMLVRTLISEGQVRWEVAGRNRYGFTTQEVVRPGPIAFVMTTTHNLLHREDETRALSILVEDTPRHTRDVIKSIALRYGGEPPAASFDKAPWHAYQRWLESGSCEVAVPYAAALGERFWAHINRSKRDFEQLMTAVGVSAVMHQARRERDATGRIIASYDDYAMARRFLDKPINEASGSMIPPSVRETVQALLDHGGVKDPNVSRHDAPGLSMQDLALSLGGIDKSSVSRRVAKAIDLGLVADLGRGNGFPSQLVVVHPLPDDWDVLPPADVIQEAMESGLITMEDYARRRQEREQEKAKAEEAAASEAAAPAPESVDAASDAPGTPGPAPLPAPEPTAPPQAIPEIIANAPQPDEPDGGYHGRRAITAYRAAIEQIQQSPDTGTPAQR